MLLSIFLPKNKKLVRKWKKEHAKIYKISENILNHYYKGNEKLAKKELKTLSELTLNHLMDEDVELYKLLRSNETISEEIKELTIKFEETFRDTKMVLMSFLSKYNHPDTSLDDEFFSSFNQIVEVLVGRIDFEENTLYAKLDKVK